MLQYGTSIFITSLLFIDLSFDDRKFLDMTINLYHIYNSKVSTRHKIHISLDEFINVASDFDIISNLVVKFNQAIKIVLLDDKKINYQNGSSNDDN
jgi:hypothetical protein